MMDKREELKRELQELIKQATELTNLAAAAKDAAGIVEFGMEYQNWYTRAIKIVEILAPDRLVEFISYYQIDPKRKSTNAQNYVIQDFIMGRRARTLVSTGPLWNINNRTTIRVYNQLQILQSLETRIDSVLSDVQGSLLSELQDKELATAEELLKVNVRAAGSLAGVVLENHLQKVMQNHHVTASKKSPTISEMNNLLKSNEIYDLPTWKKVEYLGSIRNLCSHKKEREPKKEEVEELIAGVNKVIKETY